MADVTRLDLLAALHQKLQPKVYLEIGVQYGPSLALAEKCELAVGVDPMPLIDMTSNSRPNQAIAPMTSDAFFKERWGAPPVDLAFIDGMHLAEYAIRDWLNIQKLMRPGGVIVFDDVLPYNAAIASRVQPPGDWTGDVWRCFYILQDMFAQVPYLVDTFPTGTMVLLNVEPRPSLTETYLPMWEMESITEADPPDEIINRTNVYTIEQILEMM